MRTSFIKALRHRFVCFSSVDCLQSAHAFASRDVVRGVFLVLVASLVFCIFRRVVVLLSSMPAPGTSPPPIPALTCVKRVAVGIPGVFQFLHHLRKY